MQPSDAPVLLYLWDKRTFYLSAFAEPLQLSQAAAMLLVGLDDELLIHSQGAALRCRSVLLPPGLDPIPMLDEIVFGLGTILLANWKRRKNDIPPLDGTEAQP